MSAGRNDPCPCGSGRKYKKCCLSASAAGEDSLYGRLRECEGTVVDKVKRFARKTLGQTALAEALEDFQLDLPLPEGEEPDTQVFIPWFVFDWVPPRRHAAGGIRKPSDAPVTSAGSDPAPVAGAPSLMDAYLAAEGRSLSDLEREFVEAVRCAPFSFHEVLEADPGSRMRVRDILRGEEFQVTERSASGSVHRGDVLYGRVVPLKGLSIFEGIASVILPPSSKTGLVALRRALREEAGEITTQTLRRDAEELRAAYHEMRQRAFDRARPTLQNTDGDLLEFHTLTYRVPSAEEAFDALAPLAVGETKEALLHGAGRDADGRLRKIDFSWLKRGNKKHPTWDNTVLGSLRIEGDRLTVEVNSARRARKVQAEIRKRLGARATLLKTGMRSVEEAMAEMKRKEKTAAGRRRRLADEAFRRRPEVQAMVQKQTDAHWEAWVHLNVPALGNRTPAEAVADPDGREMVEALLTEFERSDARRQPGQPRIDVAGLRRRLGLAPTP